MRTAALSALLLLFVVGCSTVSRSYTVTLKNDTKTALTIGFTHDGETDTDQWIPPEELALDPTVKPELTLWGDIVMPGKTASTKKPLVGHMPSDANAYLRVYRGHPTLLQVLATGRTSPDRVDIPLLEGANSVTIVDRDGKLAVVRGGDR